MANKTRYVIPALISAFALRVNVPIFRVKAGENRTQAVTLEYQQYKLDQQAQEQQIRADAYRQMEENHAKDQQQIQELQGTLVSTQATLAVTNRNYVKVRSELVRICDAGNTVIAKDCQAAARNDVRANQGDKRGRLCIFVCSAVVHFKYERSAAMTCSLSSWR